MAVKPTKNRAYTSEEIRQLAADDDNRPWYMTSNCHMCGGVGRFIDWLDEQEEINGEVEEAENTVS